MMRVQLLKMENIFMPGFSTVTWTSTKIPEFCKDVTEVLDYIEMFVKEVSIIQQYLFKHLPLVESSLDQFLSVFNLIK